MIQHIAETECSPILISDSLGELLDFLRRRGIQRRRSEVRLMLGAIASVRLSGEEARRVGDALPGLPRTSWGQFFWKVSFPHLMRSLVIRNPRRIP